MKISHLEASLALAVGKFSVAVKGKLLLGQKIGLGTFFCLTDLGCFFRTGDHGL